MHRDNEGQEEGAEPIEATPTMRSDGADADVSTITGTMSKEGTIDSKYRRRNNQLQFMAEALTSPCVTATDIGMSSLNMTASEERRVSWAARRRRTISAGTMRAVHRTGSMVTTGGRMSWKCISSKKSKALALNSGLVVAVIVYAFLGAGVFIWLEAATQRTALLNRLRRIRALYRVCEGTQANLGKHLSHVAIRVYTWTQRSRREKGAAALRRSHSAETASAHTLGGDEPKEPGEGDDTPEEPSGPIVLVVFIFYVLLGAATMPLIEEDMDFVNSIYTNVMSVTAVDFSAIVGGNEMFVPLKLVYACIGLAIATVAIEAGSNYLRKLHYFGRKVNVNAAFIWVGGQRISVNNLVKAVGRQAGVDITAMHQLDLGRVVESAVAAEAGFMLPEEEQALLARQMRDTKDPNRIRFIDSDPDSQYGDKDPPPPPPPASHPPSDLADMDDFQDNSSGRYDSRQGAQQDNGSQAGSGRCWSLARIQEESGQVTPEPRTPPESSYGTPEPEMESEMELSILGSAWSPSSGSIVGASPPLLPHQWRPTPPERHSPRLIGSQWRPSPPHGQLPRSIGSKWSPTSPPTVSPRAIGSQWRPTPPSCTPSVSDVRVVGSQWRPSPPLPDGPVRLLGWRWSPSPEPQPVPKAPTPPPLEPGAPTPPSALPVCLEADGGSLAEADAATLPPSDPEPSTPATPPHAQPPHASIADERHRRPLGLPPGEFEKLVRNAVRRATQEEFGRRKVRADAKKRMELYQREWEKVQRLTKPRLPGVPGSPSGSGQHSPGSPASSHGFATPDNKPGARHHDGAAAQQATHAAAGGRPVASAKRHSAPLQLGTGRAKVPPRVANMPNSSTDSSLRSTTTGGTPLSPGDVSSTSSAASSMRPTPRSSVTKALPLPGRTARGGGAAAGRGATTQRRATTDGGKAPGAAQRAGAAHSNTKLSSATGLGRGAAASRTAQQPAATASRARARHK